MSLMLKPLRFLGLKEIFFYFVFILASFSFLISQFAIGDYLKATAVLIVFFLADKYSSKVLYRTWYFYVLLLPVLFLWPSPHFQVTLPQLKESAFIAFPFLISAVPVVIEMIKGRADKEHHFFINILFFLVFAVILITTDKSLWIVAAVAYSAFLAKMIYEFLRNRYRLEPYFGAAIYLPWLMAVMGSGAAWYFKNWNILQYLGVYAAINILPVYAFSKWKNKRWVMILWLLFNVIYAFLKFQFLNIL